MKTNSFIHLKKLCFILIICFSTCDNAQQKIPKNYVGLSGVAELNRLALGAGIEYERWFYAKNQFAIGAKGHYIFPSKTINGIFSTGDQFQRNSQLHVMATSYFFTNQDKEAKGFFLSFGAGVNFIKWEAEAYDASGNSYIRSVSEVSPGFDFSVGGQYSARRTAARVTAGYQTFSGDKYDQLISGHGVSLLYLKLSLGF
jgi:hypothetical protein